ncbi:MAG: hypothetical protein OEV43_05140 [Coriobacteriia bacterium]|nr:hypothetical protein [Coriobacteriia bacterium]
MDDAERPAHKPPSPFLSLPSTSVGKWSARLLLLSLVLALLNSFVVMPVTEQRTSLELAQAVFNFAAWLCVASAGTSGLFALVVKRERSWAVVLSVVILALTVGLMVTDLIIPA